MTTSRNLVRSLNFAWMWFLFRWKLQRGTKVLTHFLKMAPFCIVDILIPFPCLPQPLPPKINVEFWTLKSFFYFRQHWFRGWGDLRRLKRNKWIKCLLKAPVLNKCVNYFCPWLYHNSAKWNVCLEHFLTFLWSGLSVRASSRPKPPASWQNSMVSVVENTSWKALETQFSSF